VNRDFIIVTSCLKFSRKSHPNKCPVKGEAYVTLEEIQDVDRLILKNDERITQYEREKLTEASVKRALEIMADIMDGVPDHQQKQLLGLFFNEIRVGLEDIEAHLILDTIWYLHRKRPNPHEFDWTKGWYTGPRATQTRAGTTYPVVFQRSDLDSMRRCLRKYRNPVIYAQELEEEMARDNLTRRQIAERHGISSDRITQWLCLLKLPEQKLSEIKALGDYWGRQMVTERHLRYLRRSLKKTSEE
jgi:hypothetical protein